MPTYSHVQPRWVMMGWEDHRHETPYFILASDTLSYGELEQKYDEYYTRFVGEHLWLQLPKIYTVKAEMASWTVVNGSSWAEAMDNLMGKWTPDAELKEIGA